MRLQPMMRFRTLLTWCLLGLSLGCRVTAEDIEYWKGTVKGPGKIVAVMLSDNYPMDLRTRAALALIEMERQDVEGVPELQRTVQRLDAETRRQLIDGMTPGLEALMRGADSAQAPAEGEPPPPQQVRAKDAAYLLITHAQGQTRQRLIAAVVGWYVVDFNGRSLAGNYSAEQVVRSLGTQAASMLVDALNPRMPQPALVKLAQIIQEVGDDDGKQRAGQRLVEIELEMEADPFLDWLKGIVRTSLQAQTPDQPVDEARVASIAAINRENFINDGALPAMKNLAAQPVVADRLLAIAALAQSDRAIVERRKRALQALEGNATMEHLRPLLALALGSETPTPVRDNAFDRLGDIRSPQAIPEMWPLVQSADNQRLRWRAGEMVLHIGGPSVVAEFFTKLPTGDEIEYEPEELEGYATRMSQMSPPPTNLVRVQLESNDWWDRVIALRYFERKGVEGDIRAMRRLVRDNTAVRGSHWENFEITTVGKLAESAIAGLQERLAGGDSAEEGAGSEADSGGQ